MRLVLFFLGGIVLANIIAATFFWQPEPEKREPIVNSATMQGQDPWMANERYNVGNRDRTRKSTLETLDKPWASFCTEEGHEHLIRIINNYYGQRGTQEWSYGHTYGEEARRYVVKVWSTTDDNRIERLMVETFGRGYFTLAELRSDAREKLALLVKGTAVSAKPCSGN